MNKLWFTGVLIASFALQLGTAQAEANGQGVCFAWGAIERREDAWGQMVRTQAAGCFQPDGSTAATLLLRDYGGENMAIELQVLSLSSCPSGGECVGVTGMEEEHWLSPGENTSWTAELGGAFTLSCFCYE